MDFRGWRVGCGVWVEGFGDWSLGFGDWGWDLWSVAWDLGGGVGGLGFGFYDRLRGAEELRMSLSGLSGLGLRVWGCWV